MNKGEMINGIAIRLDMPKSKVEAVLNEAQTKTLEALKEGEEVQFFGLGKLVVRDVDERKARNPRTGEEVTVPAHKAPKMRFSKALKDELKGG